MAKARVGIGARAAGVVAAAKAAEAAREPEAAPPSVVHKMTVDLPFDVYERLSAERMDRRRVGDKASIKDLILEAIEARFPT